MGGGGFEVKRVLDALVWTVLAAALLIERARKRRERQ